MRRRHLLVLLVLLLAAATFSVSTGADARVASLPSQRQWMSANGEWPGIWVSRYGGTDGSLTRTGRPEVPGGWAKAAPPGKDCMTSCHARAVTKLRRSRVVSPGFTNWQGTTPTYEGTLYPYKLLTDPANTTGHAEIFAAKGCGGCHSPAAAEEFGWNVVRGCESCHNFSFLGWDPVGFLGNPNPNTDGNLHSTHMLIAAEIPLADPAGVGKPACMYCHTFGDPEVGKASCWNCHMSGHWPQVPYWKPAG